MKSNQKRNQTLQPGDSIDAFLAHLGASADHIKQAAQMLQRMVIADGTVIDRILACRPAMSEGFLNALLKVAGMELHPELVMSRCAAYRKIANFAFAVQESIIDAGNVPVVVDAKSGKVVEVGLTKLEGPQVRQVFSVAGVRSVAEQRAWIQRQQPTRSRGVQNGRQYRIQGERVTFFGGFTFSRNQLLKIAEEMAA